MDFNDKRTGLWKQMKNYQDQLSRLTPRQGRWLVFSAVGVLFAASVALYGLRGSFHLLPSPEEPHLRINEVSVSQGWVELYNPTEEAISLNGWSLSNKKTDLHRYPFPEDAVIEAEAYLLVGMERSEDENPLKMDFSVKRGDTVCLSQEGTVMDVLSTPYTLQAQTSFGYTQEGLLSPLSPTPGEDNSQAEVYSLVEAPVFSAQSGFYDKPFTLSIKVPDGASVYYTLDGSTPTPDSEQYTKPLTITDATENPNVYSKNQFLGALRKTPLADEKPAYQDYYANYLLPKKNVDKCTVLRAIAVDEQGMTSEVTTASYFVGFGQRKGYEKIPVLSLVSDPEGLYGMENGIMVTGNRYLKALDKGEITTATKWYAMRDYFHYFQSGSDWERPIHIDYFNSDKSFSFTQEAGIRMHGNTSRRAAQKSFSLLARSEYDGNNEFLKPFFADGLTTDKVLLTTALSPRRYVLSQRMNAGRAMYTQDHQLIQVFLDGEYCGFYAMQEAYDSDTYLEDHYGVDTDDTVLMKGKGGSWVYEMGEEGDYETYYQPLLDFISKNDLSDPETYAQLDTMMDIESFIDFYAAQIYIANLDWYEGQNGVLFYSKKLDRSNPYADQRWHWILYDLDYSSGSAEASAAYPSFTGTRLSKSQSLSNDPFFPYLMKNERFCQQFINAFLDMGNGIYDSDTMTDLLDQLAEDYREMAWVCVQRYPKTDDSLTLNKKTHDTRFKANCEEMKSFFQERFQAVLPDLEAYFGISGQLYTLTLSAQNANGGTVHLNTLTPDLSSGQWQGRYHSACPVTLTAEPAEGYVFAGWKVSKNGVLTEGDQPYAELRLLKDTTVEAIFEKE